MDGVGRRRTERVEREARLEMNGRRGGTLDLSATGLGAELYGPVRPGAFAFGRVYLGGRGFEFKGEVAWARTGCRYSRVGVRFHWVETGYFEQLARRRSLVAPVGVADAAPSPGPP